MYGREELKTYISCELYDKNSDEFKAGDAYLKEKADSVMESMERRIARLTWCVDAWKQANADLQRTNTRLRKAISLNSLKEIEYMYAENADLKKRVKELEEENKHLDDYIDTYQKSEALNIEKLDKKDERIKELEVVISKMETTAPKWVSTKDRFPCEDGEYQVVYQHKNGANVASVDEWDNDCQDWMNATDRVNVIYWADLLPPPPTTKEV